MLWDWSAWPPGRCWSMLVSLATWSMLGGGMGGSLTRALKSLPSLIVAEASTPSVPTLASQCHGHLAPFGARLCQLRTVGTSSARRLKRPSSMRAVFPCVFHALIVCSVFKNWFSGRSPKLDQVVNAVCLIIWSMLIGVATWSMMGGGLGGH